MGIDKVKKAKARREVAKDVDDILRAYEDKPKADHPPLAAPRSKKLPCYKLRKCM